MAYLAQQREAVIQRGKRLEHLTIGWNCLEGLAAMIAGSVARSISLVGFGLDSFIEVASALALLWRISVDEDAHRRERHEGVALRAVGVCFLALAAFVAYESISDLLHRHATERSVPGIIVACAALVVMPLFSRAKKRVSRELGSVAMKADAKQADFCAWLSGILLAGLLLNAAFGWWWADPAAALIMVPLIAKEGVEGLQGKDCCNSCD